MPQFIDAAHIIKTKNVDVDCLESRRLSPDSVIIETNRKNPRFAVLTIPASFKESIFFQTLLSGFTIPWYALDLGESGKSSANDSVNKLFIYIEKNKYLNKLSPIDVLHEWKNFLVENNTTYDIWKLLSELLKIFRHAIDHYLGKTSHLPSELKDALFLLRSITPTKPSHAKIPPIGLYLGIPQNEFSNSELLMGLRYGCLWLLQKLEFFKSSIAQDPVVATTLGETEGMKTEWLLDFFRNKSTIYFNRNSESDRKQLDVISGIWKTIQTQPLLTEWQFYSFSKLIAAVRSGNSPPFNQNHQQMLTSRCIDEKGNIRWAIQGYGQNDSDWRALHPYLGSAAKAGTAPLPCFWGLDLLAHSGLEKLLMVWILSTERIQQSGIKSLTLSSLEYSDSKRSLQITTIKRRRGQSNGLNPNASLVKSQIYKRSDPPFNVYHQWAARETKLAKHLPDYNPDEKYIPHLLLSITGSVIKQRCKQFANAYLPLELIGITGTTWNTTFLSETSEKGIREALAFIKIIQTLGKKALTNSKTKTSLPTSIINQSVVVQQQSGTSIRRRTEIIEAETLGHTITVNKNVYQTGFRQLDVREICEPVRHFARMVGDAKYSAALKIADHFSAISRKISLSEVRNILDIKDIQTDQAALIATLSERDLLTIDGEIAYGDELLIVQTDMTAAMMSGYIKHIEKSLPLLNQTSRSDTTIGHLAKLIHLHQTLETFPTKLQRDGEKLAAVLDFKFPLLN